MTTSLPLRNLAGLLPSGFPGYPGQRRHRSDRGESRPAVALVHQRRKVYARPTLWATARCSNLRRTSPGQRAGPRRFTCPTSSILRRRANWAREIMGGIWLSWRRPIWSKGRTMGRWRGCLYKLGAMFNTYNGSTGTGVHYPSHGLLAEVALLIISGHVIPATGKNWSTSTPSPDRMALPFSS